MAEITTFDRNALARHGKRLEYFTIAWNTLEGLVAVFAGVNAGSISLVAFGIDSFIEVASGGALLWRMSADADEGRREKREVISLRIVGVCFLGLALYVGYEALASLVRVKAPGRSIAGILLAVAAVFVMPVLARAKRRVSAQLGSSAMAADAKQTQFCTYLSAILLGGLFLNAVFGLWWADPVAALVMVPAIGKEGIEGLQGKTRCAECH
ncbi:MAG TPA: cation transporter [Terriglobia bacterium]|nr:cation transporter [Terriglobia bacterium]